MTGPPSTLALDPALLARIADLELAARLIVEGARLGAHRSPFTGSGAEFQQMRPYLPGDDLKHLDWKHYARTDRLFTRVYRETTEWPVMLAVDASRSMALSSTPGVSKLRVAAVLAAALAYLLVQQGESVGLIAHGDEPRLQLPPRTGRPHLVRVLGQLDRLEPSGGTALARGIRTAATRLGRRGIVAVISDLFADDDATTAAVREVRRMGHEVVLFHVLTPEERVLPDDGDVSFEDLETGERVVTSVPAIRAAYVARLGRFLGWWRSFAAGEGITFVDAHTDAPLDAVLRAFSQQRAALAGGSR
ncbi:hypothetical protein TBR22_A25830 [Luteitalea sp. TBR-22]|uniref:DUF58 domain-containing protein n=1 Tax=Luteitalea sp. TBR-22 TaxID=2802971 RepID=UPI001AF077B4|nr:DUF58 domain-containing protein [Luteitalea sp. TBR-22]BCS33356.1 hypothetical protein TBR22_A25830 [Luteitalea sp. TBR-22]